MKASTVNKLNNLLNIGIPASKQDCPLYIRGTLEDSIIETVIAPRIEQEEEQ